MPSFTTVFTLAAVAGSLVQAAPVARGAPADYYVPYLEPYDTYHLRYLALGCQNKHDTSFFEDCCHPLLSTQSLSDRPSYCTPNATEIASASAYIASTSVSGAPTTTVDSGNAAPAAATPATTTASSSSTQGEDASEYSVAETPSSTTTAAAFTTQAALAKPTTTSSTTTYQAPTTTSSTPAPTTTSQSSGGGGGQQTGGFATYFYQGGNAGACGNYNSDSAHIVAIDSAWWSNFGVQSDLCGKQIQIWNTANGKSTTATIADVCPTCANGNSLDLSVGAFTAIASESDGMVPITWSFI